MQAAGTYQAYLHSETLRVVTPYLVLGCIAFFWALLILMTKFPELGGEEVAESSPTGMHVRLWQRHFVFAVVAQFLYVGAQVGTWSYFIGYVESATGVGDKAAGYMLTGTLAAFAVGRFSSAWLMRHFHARLMLVLYSVFNVVCAWRRWCIRAGWAWVVCSRQPVHVDHVPDDFCAWREGDGREDEDRGVVSGDGDPGRRGADQGDGHAVACARLQAAYLVPVACFVGVALYAWLFAEAKAGEAARLISARRRALSDRRGQFRDGFRVARVDGGEIDEVAADAEGARAGLDEALRSLERDAAGGNELEMGKRREQRLQIACAADGGAGKDLDVVRACVPGGDGLSGRERAGAETFCWFWSGILRRDANSG